MGAVVSCFQAIGACIMTVINAIAGVLMAIINGIVAVLKAIVSFLTCGFCGSKRSRRGGGTTSHV
ncbi:hypothetical protein N0V93_009156 [Gnomoniopsis smithogilvyi]|uniref:Uncharacterized protein n=1 Tax=Gnomoniopsis smithogilvyi TaxID=1191159 RepID=A0A9W9CTD9_9PEZI|nr:hypothetical protein N0V93_009156 [Gnomoniopsis smithogilvyi]